jgi:alpha/beta superfamily hydrolase
MRPDAAATRLVPVTIEGPVGPLEGLLQVHESESHPIAALMCHPHPLYGGTMHNKVVHRAAATLHDLGAAVLRFNFRGAGKSAGKHDQGAGELDDARAALAFLKSRVPAARSWIGGFSFGSWIAARLAATEPDTERLILIAPPVRRSSFEALESAPIPKLVFQGTADTVCPLADLESVLPRWADPKRLIPIEGASHFFDRQLGALANAMREALSSPTAGATSETT